MVVEDSAALIGLVIAAVGLLLSRHFNSGRPDAFASLLIGLLMAATAFGLGRLLVRLDPKVWFRNVEDLRTVFPNRVPAP